MKYAVIISGGKQYKVSEGNTILVDNLDGENGKTINFPQILLVRTEKSIIIGNPFVEGANVCGKILDTVLGKKINVIKFKAKVRYRRKIGFRPQYTKILIENIETNSIHLDKEEKKFTSKRKRAL